MISLQIKSAYQQASSPSHIEPARLVHMLYGRILYHFELAEAGIKEKNSAKKSEHFGKAIGILTELYSSVEATDSSEAARFLRGVYGAILEELPKASSSDDIRTLKMAQGYLERLKGVWERAAL
ncbi:MAG: flagellar protein FliS [Desulfobulbaceae bacterium]|nr:flagellar protein FliS [Desulfobulbaceae bacterium]